MFQLVDFWRDIFLARPDIGGCDPGYLNDWSGKYWLTMKSTEFEIPVPMSASSQTAFLLAKLRQAIQTDNGDFFRKLADTIERSNTSPVDRMRYWLSEKFYPELSQGGTDGTVAKVIEDIAKTFEGIGIPCQEITLDQLYNEMKREGILGDKRQLRRACKELGIMLAPDRRGRPKGRPSKVSDPK